MQNEFAENRETWSVAARASLILGFMIVSFALATYQKPSENVPTATTVEGD